MNTYRTVDLARMFGIHVNTVRLYERYGLIPKFLPFYFFHSKCGQNLDNL